MNNMTTLVTEICTCIPANIPGHRYEIDIQNQKCEETYQREIVALADALTSQDYDKIARRLIMIGSLHQVSRQLSGKVHAGISTKKMKDAIFDLDDAIAKEVSNILRG